MLVFDPKWPYGPQHLFSLSLARARARDCNPVPECAMSGSTKKLHLRPILCNFKPIYTSHPRRPVQTGGYNRSATANRL